MCTTAGWERKVGSGGTHCEEGATQRGVAPAPTQDASRRSSVGAQASRRGLPGRCTIRMHEAVRVADRLFHAAGTNGIYRKYGLERYFRDVHTAVQHAAGLPVHIESAGKVLLGLRLHDLGW